MVRAEGLEGVVVADTELSSIDGEQGRLIVRGHDVEALAGHASFEAVCTLLWSGELPAAGGSIESALGQARVRAHETLPHLGRALDAPDAMDALRAAAAQLVPLEGDDVRIALTGALPVFAAAWLRRRRGESPLEPDPRLGHAADFLRLATGTTPGTTPDATHARALDAYFVTVADHGMNASTFTARVVASTLSDPVSAVVAAIGALKGPAHGGAPGPVLAMIDDIGTPERAPAWIESALARGERIMGMGHRVYRARDPRAAVLEVQVEALEASGAATQRLGLARAVERAALDALGRRHPDRVLAANVEFYTAVLLSALGLPAEMFTPTFACARVAGWLAHVEEQQRTGRLIRPRSRYVGPPPADAVAG